MKKNNFNNGDYVIDIKWFDCIHCRQPEYSRCVNLKQFYILNDNNDIIDRIELFPNETTDGRFFRVDKVRYHKIIAYMSIKNIKEEKLKEKEMTSKEALNRLLCMAKKGCKVDMCNVKYVKNASDIIEKELERLKNLENENQKLKEIIKENFDYFEDSKEIIFAYTGPVMEEEILEVLEND